MIAVTRPFQVMMEDPELHAILRSPPVRDTEGGPATLRMSMVMTQQPCHFASGRVENAAVTGRTSCTLGLLEWWGREQLAARGVVLEIKVAYVAAT